MVLSFYHEPDLCPGSFRNTALVEALSKKLGKRGAVTVLTALPHRYSSYNAEAMKVERNGNVLVHRVSLPRFGAGVFAQSIDFLKYAFEVLKKSRNGNYDLVYASSSRSMTAALGALVARRDKVPLYLDIRDVFIESAAGVFSRLSSKMLLALLTRLERWYLSASDRINLVSPAFADYFFCIAPDKEYRFYTNGVDLKGEGCCGPRRLEKAEAKEILYAGNIGDGQMLHEIIPRMARVIPPDWRITVIGDGSKRASLEQQVVHLENVSLEPPAPREELAQRYTQASVLFLHLNGHEAFRRVLPSKLFEYAATGLPIIAGLQGFSADFIDENIENAEHFAPGDVAGFRRAFNAIRLEYTPRAAFCRKYDRKRISFAMAEDILELAGLSRGLTSSSLEQ